MRQVPGPKPSSEGAIQTDVNEDVAERLQRIEQMLELLIQQRTIKEWYTTAEIAKILGKAEFTVREWCRLKRIHATKKECGRGVSSEWIISHEELVRVQNHELLPSENDVH